MRGFLEAAARARGLQAARGLIRCSRRREQVRLPPHAASTPRIDLVVIADMVAPGARVLDVGCGDGALLRLLAENRGVDGRGIEISREGVNDCVARGSPSSRATPTPTSPTIPTTPSTS